MSTSFLEGAAFETFVEGPSNHAGLAAARQLAERPGAGANPLVLVGPPGVGKTHLLTAIATAVGPSTPTGAIELETAAGLTARAHGNRGGITPLHECGLLLLDGIEQMVGHPELEAILLELLLGRVPFGRPVAITSRRLPADLGPDSTELANELGAGKIVVLDPPDAGTRLAILRSRAADLTPGLGDDVLTAIARLPIASVRELLAAIQRLVAFQSVSPVPLDPAQARLLVTGGADADPDEGEAGSVPAEVTSARRDEREPETGDSLAVADDEFGSFLTEVVASVSHQVDRWRTRVGDAILRYGGEGFRTHRLEALLEQEMPARPADVLAAFERDAQRLRELEAAAAALVPELAGTLVFRDPDRIPEAETALARARLRRNPLPVPNADLRLDRFVEAAGTRRALQAARQVVQGPGGRDNPLVIVGPSGTGKSHLVHGIANLLAADGAPVACLSAPGLVAEMLRLRESGDLDDWRSRHRHAAAIMLDDLHLLAGHPDAQQEFLDLVTHLLETGQQVVVSSSVVPSALSGIDAGLLSRLEGGLVVELARPDRELRLMVVKELLAGTAATGDSALADWLAMRPADSVRAVQGAVHQVLSAAEAEGVTPSPALAREVLSRGSSVGRTAGRGSPGATSPPPHRAGLGPEKMVLVWPRAGDRLIEGLE